MYSFLQIIGITSKILLYFIAVLAAICWALSFLFMGIWPLIPFVTIILIVTIVQIRKRRAAAVLGHLNDAVRLNLPLSSMLGAAARSEKGRLKKRLLNLQEKLASGMSVSQSLAMALPELPASDVMIVAVGERTGRLPQALDRIMRIRRRDNRKQDIYGGLYWLYQLFVLIMILGAMVFMGIRVIPGFKKVILDMGIKTPPLTKGIFDIADMLGIDDSVGYLPLFVMAGIILAGLIFILLAWLGPLRPLWQRIKWMLPVIGGMERDRGLGDVCHLLAESVDAGLPIDRALRETARLKANPHVMAMVDKWALNVAAGQTVDQAAAAARLPQMVTGLLATAQATADLPATLRFLANYFDNRCGVMAAMIKAVGPPVIILVLAIIEGLIVTGFFLPLVETIRHLADMGFTS